MSEQDTINLIQQTLAQKQFNVAQVGFHKHTGSDSPQVKFIYLSDVPNSYSGSGGGVVVVNQTETGLIFQSILQIADGTSVTPLIANSNFNYQINTQTSGTLTINAPLGTPTDGQKLILRFKTTHAQTYSFNSIYRSGGVILPTTSTAGHTDYIGFIYNAVDTMWDCVATALDY